MEYLNVVVAAVAAWIFGAIWYGAIARQWMQASGLTEDMIDRKNPVPYIISLVGSIVVAGMMRHAFASSGIVSLGGGMLAGFGLGLFVVVPWMVNNVLYGQRDRRLIWMDGAYPVVGMTLMGLVLNAF